ncbi:AN1-type zinc finger protein 2B [Lamellibrachia satsuma]|nr:AN1-type zinc finger protein 2B [Lamellibrachia satsuma]
MEFPDLGEHCSIPTCKQLDFLPVKCDACHKIFCHEHYQYAKHDCTESYAKDNQIPVCPLCNTPIPVKKGESPDVRVGQHIDNDCQSDPAKEKRKIYTNRCALKGCKQKELIPFKCDRCHQNYCLRHRLEADHTCQGFEQSGKGISHSGASAVARSSTVPVKAGPSAAGRRSAPQTSTLSAIGRDLDRERQQRQSSNAHTLQAGLSEDEAMARAIAMSLQTSDTPVTNPRDAPQSAETRQQEEEDLALARALQASERDAAQARTRQQTPKERSCVVS